MISLHVPPFLRSSVAGLLACAWQLPCIGAGTMDAPAADVAPPLVVPPALPEGGGYIALGDALRVQGQSVHAWALDAPGAPADVAMWLTQRQPALRDLWVMPDAILLAGVANGVHWTARLADAGAGRTWGTLSVLALERDPAPPPAAWRLPGGRLQFELRSREDRAELIQQIWTHATPPVLLETRLAGELAADGWREAAPRETDVAMQAWVRGRMTLSVAIVPFEQGSGVTAIVRIGA
ncbi:hypothetical protein [Bordetella bronchialis]|uniref:Uncharacterized protein n=1 Tax=Bordetella bronchialis TaxID=463025 RepID=A0A193FUY7_9BORD|nr:hypothetical protein [Bordetella bronchialis]ANN71572.1 hypothetical protein BAU08_09675 [Bordetella bronchialis]